MNIVEHSNNTDVYKVSESPPFQVAVIRSNCM